MRGGHVWRASEGRGCGRAGGGWQRWRGWARRAGGAGPAGGATAVGAADASPLRADGIRAGIPPAPDGTLWSTEQLATGTGRTTPAGLVTEFSVPTADSEPLGITAGPDGNLWFTEFSGNR